MSSSSSSSSSSGAPSSSASTDSGAVPQYRVEVWLYDLTQGLARQFSAAFLGRQLDGIWHTGVVVYGYEYFYGGGITSTRPGHTMAGQPLRKLDLGFTALSQETFHAFLRGISHRYTPATYSLLSHNCNNFSHEAVQFLTGRDMPAYITGLPEEALSSPLGAMLRPVIANMEAQFKQQNGMGGALPWSEDLLTLPPLDARPDRYHSLTTQETQQTAQAEQQSRQPDIPGAATTILSPTASSTPHHPHAALGLQVVSAQSRPLLSADRKNLVSFLTLVKANGKKLPDIVGLREEERKLLETTVAVLGKDGEMSEEEERKAELLFDRLLQDWPVEQLFPVLGLLRVLVLRPRVAAYYEDKEQAVVSRLLAFLPSPSAAPSSPSPPVAAQAMSLCVISNFFARPSFASKLSTNAALLAATRHTVTACSHVPTRTIAAAVLYNLSLCLPKDESDDNIELVSLLAHHSLHETDAEVEWRLLMAMAHVMYGNSSLTALVGAGLDWDGQAVLSRFAGNQQIDKVVRDMHKMIAHDSSQ